MRQIKFLEISAEGIAFEVAGVGGGEFRLVAADDGVADDLEGVEGVGLGVASASVGSLSRS